MTNVHDASRADFLCGRYPHCAACAGAVTTTAMRDAPHRRQRRPITSGLYLFALFAVGCDASGALGDYDDPDASAATDARARRPPTR